MTAEDSAAMIRIVVADDQTAVRDGLMVMLDLFADITVVGGASNGLETLALTAQHHPDVVLVDLHMPGLDGIETTRRLSAEHPDVVVVVLTTYSDDTSVLDALDAGARGYLTKNAGRDGIARAIRAAANGQSVLDPAVQAALVQAATRPSQTATPTSASCLPDGLTRREGEVLTLLAQGLTNRDIAAALFLSGHTVKTHVRRIFFKSGSKTRAQAVRYAQQHGLAAD